MNPEKSNWKISIVFHNSSHTVVSVVDLLPTSYSGTEKIEDVVYPAMLERVRQLNWKGFGLWAQHEPIYKQTILDEINYQRKSDGAITLDCEDHACNYRAVLTPVVKSEECVICADPLKDKLPVLMCFHQCVCASCFEKIDKCPVCRKPRKSNKATL
jgi:hypothetical protein